jgi:hypothetical protein
MKFTILLPAFLALAAMPLHAFGPGPFRNGSPLASGTDGVYQAVATAPNVTGLFSWTISGGVQTSDVQNNKWIFFVDGQLLTGNTVANVSEGKVAGVLESGLSTGIPTSADGSLTPPVVFVIAGNAASGQFQGKINLKSPVAAFKGNGNIEGTPLRVDQVIYISEIPDILFLEGGSSFNPVIAQPVLIPGSTLQNTEFAFRGTRLSLTAPAPAPVQAPAPQN